MLLVIDVQNDFCPGGALAVGEGDAVVPVINRLVRTFQACRDDAGLASAGPQLVCHDASRFGSVRNRRHAIWPANAVAGSLRAGHCRRGVPSELMTERAELIIRKGFRPEIDSYSAFLRKRPAHADRTGGLFARAWLAANFHGGARDRLLRSIIPPWTRAGWASMRCGRVRLPGHRSGGFAAPRPGRSDGDGGGVHAVERSASGAWLCL